jgi:hypothetical protein
MYLKEKAKQVPGPGSGRGRGKGRGRGAVAEDGVPVSDVASDHSSSSAHSDASGSHEDGDVWLVEKEWGDAVADESEALDLVRVRALGAEKEEFTRIDTNAIIGSRTIMRVGSKNEAISVYCRLHQCKTPLKRTAHAPTLLQVKEWFKAGLSTPSGAAGREQHMNHLWNLHCGSGSSGSAG